MTIIHCSSQGLEENLQKTMTTYDYVCWTEGLTLWHGTSVEGGISVFVIAFGWATCCVAAVLTECVCWTEKDFFFNYIVICSNLLMQSADDINNLLVSCVFCWVGEEICFLNVCVCMCTCLRVISCVLTLHCECDRLTGFILPVLVIDCLGVVASCIRGHRGQDDQRVIQGDGTE